MTNEPCGNDDQIAERLADWDERLEQGEKPHLAADDESASHSGRLLRGLTMLRKLHQLRHAGNVDGSALRGRDHKSEPIVLGHSLPYQLGRFKVLHELGRGGFGVVFLAQDSVLHRLVALKIPRFESITDASLRERFVNEARIAAGFDHANIVSVYDAGQIGPICYIAYAYCPGPTLAEWLHRRDEAVGVRDAARVVYALADAVHYAHERGILHRDLKPTNVILQDPSESIPDADKPTDLIEPASPIQLATANPKITDFGLAKIMDQNSAMTTTGAIVGTPGYMAPEQARGSTSQLGRSTDVYSLGAILYELISGRPPFRGESPLETLHQVMATEPVSLHRLRDRLPKDLETICQKCLQKEPHKRFATARELAEELQRFLRHEPIRTRPIGTLDRAWRWCRRRPLVAGLTTALVALALVSSLTILVNWLQLRTAHERLKVSQHTAQVQRELAESTVYFQSIALAQHQWRANRIRQAQNILQKTDPKRRGWEWDYVKRLCDSESLVLKGHRQDTTDVQFSPDGKRIASSAGTWGSAEPGELRVWDLESARCLWDRDIPAGPVWKIAFTPDGHSVAAGSSPWRFDPDPGVAIWDAVTGSPVAQLEKSYVAGMTISPNGKYLAAAENNGDIGIYDTASWTLIRHLKGHTDTPFGLAFHPDNRRLVSGSRDHTIRIWDATTGEPCLPPLRADSDVRCVDMSPDGTRCASGDWNGTVTVWDLESGKLLMRYMGHREPVWAVRFSPDGHYVASGGGDREIRIWNCLTGKDVNVLRGHDDPVMGLAFDSEGTHIASAGCHNEIRVWNVVDQFESEPLTQLLGHPMDACFDLETAEPRFLVGFVSSAQRNVVTVTNADGTDASPRSLVGHTDQLLDAVVSRDGRWIISISRDGTTRVWQHPTGRAVQVWVTPDVNCVAICPDGSLVATGQRDGTVTLWNAANPDPVKTFRVIGSTINCVSFSHDGDYLAAGTENGQVHCWHVASRSSGLRPESSPASSSCNQVELSEQSPELLNVLSITDDPITALAWSADGTRTAAGTRKGLVYLYDSSGWLGRQTDIAPPVILAGHTGPISGIAFGLDGARVLTGSEDATAKLWDTETGMEAITLVGRSDPVRGVRFSPDGRNLLILGGGTRLWRTRGIAEHQRESMRWSYHANEFELCFRDRHWFGVMWHGDRLNGGNFQDPSLLIKRADAHASLGDFTAADDDFAAALALDADNTEALGGRALLALKAGRQDQYQAICQQLLTLLHQTSDHSLINQVAWTCSLAATATDDPAQLVPMTERLVKAKANPALRGEWLNTHAAILSRAGLADRARRALEEAVAVRPAGANLFDHLFMAIVARQLGDRALQEASVQRAKESRDVPAPGIVPWRWYAERDILMQEAIAGVTVDAD